MKEQIENHHPMSEAERLELVSLGLWLARVQYSSQPANGRTYSRKYRHYAVLTAKCEKSRRATATSNQGVE